MSPIGFRVVTTVPRLSEERYAALRQFRSCDLSDAMNGARTMLGIRPIYTPISRIVGPAVTVSVPAGGFNIITMGLGQTQAGDVLVVSARGDVTYALWGGNLSFGTQRRGVAGFVIDGAVRDVVEIQAMGFPTFARGTATAASVVDPRTGEVNVPIACGGIVVNPGDIIVADEDGIVVVPPRWIDDILAEAERQTSHYRSLRPILERGEVAELAEVTEHLRGSGLEIVGEN